MVMRQQFLIMLHRLMLTASLTTALLSPQNLVWCWIPVFNFVIFFKRPFVTGPGFDDFVAGSLTLLP